MEGLTFCVRFGKAGSHRMTANPKVGLFGLKLTIAVLQLV